MKAVDLSKVQKELRGISQFFGLAAVYAAEAYGTTKWMARPIVDGHFTPGNAVRYGWQPLAKSTLTARASLGSFNAMEWLNGRRGSKGEKVGAVRVSPAMVKSGDLRNAMATTGRALSAGVESATLYFSIPSYGKFHLPGGASTPGKPPVRDFLSPNKADVELIREILIQRLSVLRGKPTRAAGLRPG